MNKPDNTKNTQLSDGKPVIRCEFNKLEEELAEFKAEMRTYIRLIKDLSERKAGEK